MRLKIGIYCIYADVMPCHIKLLACCRLTVQRMAAITVGFMTRLGSVVFSTTEGGTSTGAATPAPAAPAVPTLPGDVPSVADSAATKASAVQNALQNAIVYFLTSQSL